MSSLDSIKRPHTLSELAELATVNNYDPSRPIKEQLRSADLLRKQGMQYFQEDDYERAFVYCVRAATMILEKIPRHAEYGALNATHMKTLAGKGEELMHFVSALKPKILDRYERWKASGGEAAYERATKAAKEAEERKSTRRKEEEEEQKRRQALSERSNHEAATSARQRDLYFLGRADTPARLEQTRSGRDPPEDRYRNADVETQAQRMREENGWAQQTRRGREVLEAASQAAYADQPSSKSRQLPTPPSIAYVTPSKKNDFDFSTPQPLPLNSPTHARSDGEYFLKEPSRYTAPRRTESYPPPITTTSPIPSPQVIEYPKLMTAHQQTQGYTPSTSSMFSVPPSLLLQGPSYSLPSASSGTGSSYSSPVHQYPQHSQVSPVHSHPAAFYPLQQPSAQHQPHPNSYYNAPLPQPSAMPSSYGMPRQNAPLSSLHSHSMPSLILHDRQLPAPSMPSAVPPRPAKVPVSPPKFVPPATQTSPVNDVPLTAAGLRVVRLPRDTLNKFLAIASVNTAQKKETCGLLLGKLKNNAFLIETLLIPRQTATSDTCTMTDEEMVFEFQDGRDLLTLGWIHTHPTQSCFMSSLDLHTHSGFQSMLPEAFAIVCAPKSTPNFGIFRLTDPPGLQLILNCGEKATFHPHPDAPIYTDADSGHVQMCDGPLEIADLRNDL